MCEVDLAEVSDASRSRWLGGTLEGFRGAQRFSFLFLQSLSSDCALRIEALLSQCAECRGVGVARRGAGVSSFIASEVCGLAVRTHCRVNVQSCGREKSESGLVISAC